MTRNTLAAALAGALSLYAADFWQSKPFSEWSEKDTQRMVENSPWSKPVSVAIGGTDGPRAGRGRGNRGGNDGMGETAGAGSTGGLIEDPMSNVGGRNRNAGGGDVTGPIATATFIVRWQSALPVKEALLKQKYGSEVGASPEAKKVLEADEKVYVIALAGVAGGMLRGDMENIKKALLGATALSAKGKDDLKPVDVQFGKAAKGFEIYFFFPKKIEYSVDDREIEFNSKLESIMVRQKFKLKDMMFDGKLAL